MYLSMDLSAVQPQEESDNPDIWKKTVDFWSVFLSGQLTDFTYSVDWKYDVISQIKKPHKTVQTDLLLFLTSSAVNAIKIYSCRKS